MFSRQKQEKLPAFRDEIIHGVIYNPVLTQLPYLFAWIRMTAMGLAAFSHYQNVKKLKVQEFMQNSKSSINYLKKSLSRL
jgi:hypothetical protein